jgi:hypothetical protein
MNLHFKHHDVDQMNRKIILSLEKRSCYKVVCTFYSSFYNGLTTP